MPPLHDLRTEKFGRLTVIERNYDKRGVFWICQCDCGNKISVASSHLISGCTKSCGCLRIEFPKIALPKINRKLGSPPKRLQDGSYNPEYDKLRSKNKKVLRAERRKRGLCPQCGNEVDNNKFSKCKLCRENQRNYRRHYIIGSTGRKIYGEKREYPQDCKCELCFREKQLQYHHWDDNNSKRGIWVCVHCHIICEYIDKMDFINLIYNGYLKARQRIDNENIE